MEDFEQVQSGKETENKTSEPANGQEVLYVGIDLGTYTIAICTNKGTKFVGYSAIAYEGEQFPQSVENENILFGKAALEQTDMEPKVPVKDFLMGNTGNQEPVKFLLQHCLKSAGIELDSGESYAIIGVPAGADITYKKSILGMARGMFTGAMVADEAFCIAYGSGRMENCLIVDIGASKLNICHINGNVPGDEDQIKISFAGENIDLELIDLIREKYEDAKITKHLARQWKEEFGYVGLSDVRCEVELPLETSSEESSITEELRLACESVVPDVVSGLTKMISDSQPDIRETLRNNIYVCGGCSKIKNVGNFIEGELKELGGGKVFLSEDPDFAVAQGARKLTERMPQEFWSQVNS
ncbi:rod shape-determining protein [Methanolobus halotolerans]|uniref:rod shape-determining protein n=1 Tax=Methanolobus halotolerans TaxID=2052935 RepID=UPI001436CC53|nr:rod shape-determining protein [Methanolobus halotolerans]